MTTAAEFFPGERPSGRLRGMADSPADQDLADRYRRYLDACNAHALDRLGEFVAPDVRVDGVPTGLAEYASRVGIVMTAFPDYRWRIRHLIVNRPMLAAHLEDTGTYTGARRVARSVSPAAPPGLP